MGIDTRKGLNMAANENYDLYTENLLNNIAKVDASSLLSALSDEEIAGMARHLLPDMAQEILQLRAKLAETTTHTQTAPLLPAQLSAGGLTPPPIVCLR